MLKKRPFLLIALLIILSIVPAIIAADYTVFGPQKVTIGLQNSVQTLVFEADL